MSTRLTQVLDYLQKSSLPHLQVEVQPEHSVRLLGVAGVAEPLAAPPARLAAALAQIEVGHPADGGHAGHDGGAATTLGHEGGAAGAEELVHA